MLNVSSDGYIVYNLSAIGETVSHAHQSARFTACSTSRRPAGSLRQAVLLNAAPAGTGALKLNAPLAITQHGADHVARHCVI